MKSNNLVKLSLSIAGLLFTTLAFSTPQQATSENAIKAESEQTPAKNNVTPHSHPRDAKGLMVTEKSVKTESKVETPEADARKTTASSSVTPHNHMRDAKGIYVASKKTSKPEIKSENKTGSKNEPNDNK